MLHGHGDDTYRYEDIQLNFSSNICSQSDLTPLKAHLSRCLDLIQNYPEPAAESLAERLAKHHGISPDNVLVTNGATEAIYLIAQAFAHDVTHFSTDEPTFSEYADACHAAGLKVTTPCPIRERLRVGERSSGMGQGGGSAILRFLCNPNNPDGRVYTPQQIADEARRSTLLVVDQSYADYTQAPLLSPRQALATDNLLLLHSLTKTYAVPGLRIGYVIAPAPLVSRLRAAARPWSVNALAVEAGKWLLTHDLPAVHDLPGMLAETQRLAAALADIPQLHVTPTATTFMLIRCDTMTAAELKHRLATEHHILIRDASNFPTLTPHHFRIATLHPQANDALIAALRKIL